MRTIWKVLLGFALVVPLGAYVAGSLAASASEDGVPRQTIRIDEPGPSHHPTRTPSPGPSPTTGDDDVEVITPDVDSLDDHGGSSGPGDGGSPSGGGSDSGDDSSGHGGGGGDDSSGHGGGGGDD